MRHVICIPHAFYQVAGSKRQLLVDGEFVFWGIETPPRAVYYMGEWVIEFFRLDLRGPEFCSQKTHCTKQSAILLFVEDMGMCHHH